MLQRLNKRTTETRTCVSKQYMVEQLFIVLYVVMIFFMYTMKSIILIITFLFFMITFFYVFYKNKKFNDLSKWKQIKANRIGAKVIKCICFTAYNAMEQQRLRKETYKPEITYRYIYNDKEIISSQYAISLDDVDCNFSYTQQEAQKIVNEFKNNKTIKIFVNQYTGESAISLDKAKGYGIPYVGMTIASFMILFLVYKIYNYA